MDIVVVILVIFLLIFLLGGVGYPRAVGAPYYGGVNGILYLLAVLVLIVIVLKLLGVL